MKQRWFKVILNLSISASLLVKFISKQLRPRNSFNGERETLPCSLGDSETRVRRYQSCNGIFVVSEFFSAGCSPSQLCQIYLNDESDTQSSWNCGTLTSAAHISQITEFAISTSQIHRSGSGRAILSSCSLRPPLLMLDTLVVKHLNKVCRGWKYGIESKV